VLDKIKQQIKQLELKVGMSADTNLLQHWIKVRQVFLEGLQQLKSQEEID
jgi:hypothetical protein